MECGLKPGGDQERRYCHAQSVKSLLEVLSARRPAGVAGQEAEHEDPNEEEDDRINGNLESEHGRAEGRGWRRTRSGATILWGTWTSRDECGPRSTASGVD